MEQTCDIAIIGGGAAGLATAIFAGEQAAGRARIAVLDGAKQLGAKILVAGGGRCNVTHDVVQARDFNGTQPIVRNVLAAFNEEQARWWFESLGVELKVEPSGKLFPVSDSARTVLHALLDRCRELGVSLLTDHRVTAVRKDGQTFHIAHSQGVMRAKAVVLATGGRSLPRSGSDGFGWELAKSLGHTVTPTYPALVPLVLHNTMFHGSISGLAAEVTLSTFADGKRVDQRTGSLLWTHFGISGPVVMDASRHYMIAAAEGRSPRLVCNLLPGRTFDDVDRELTEATQAHGKRVVMQWVARFFPQRMAAALVEHAGISPDELFNQLSRDCRRALAHTLVELELPVESDRGWNYAEVTAGGVPLSEVDHRTMASRATAGLYLVGEILDCDGRIGGFNFQWAWATGHLAGTGAARSVTDHIAP
jgi:predicted Rossmann fold flavoprotein